MTHNYFQYLDKKSIDFLNLLTIVKQHNQPIAFRHFVDEFALEESTIYIEIYDSLLRLRREGKVHDIDTHTHKHVITPINDHMDLTITNIDQMIDLTLVIQETVQHYLKKGHPMYYMPDGLNYALFDLMERIGKIPKLNT